MIVFLFAVGCVCFISGILGINMLSAAAMVRDLYLNGTYMKALDVMERTNTIMLLKVDMALVAVGVAMILLALVSKIIKTIKK